MANPVILVVDDDPQVLRAVERELRATGSARSSRPSASTATSTARRSATST
jgi:DNA-binding response OmpR family regulator